MEINEEIVLCLLEKTKNEIENKPLELKTGEAFEDYVYTTMKKLSSNLGIQNIRQTGKQSFPDIIIGEYGVEVKFSTSNKWESTGNSIFEGTYQEEVTQDIFVFFGKKDKKGNIEIKYDYYENCLSDVKVTHSPRFFINMNQKPEESVLYQLKIKYDEYRKLTEHQKANLIKKYLKSKLKKGEKVWWIDDEITPIIKEFRNLNAKEKKLITAELFALFPQLLSNSRSKYFDAAVYLMTKRQLFNSSLRDIFSAGGLVTFVIDGQFCVKTPKVYKHLYQLATHIKSFIYQADIEMLTEYWLEHNIEKAQIKSDRHSAWKILIDYYGAKLPSGIRPSFIYEGGLGLKNIVIKK